MKKIDKIVAIALLVVSSVGIYQSIQIGKLKDDVAAANQRADEASALAFGDCQRIMAQNEFMVRINTCIEVINVMCKENVECMAYFQPMCTTEDYE